MMKNVKRELEYTLTFYKNHRKAFTLQNSDIPAKIHYFVEQMDAYMNRLESALKTDSEEATR